MHGRGTSLLGLSLGGGGLRNGWAKPQGSLLLFAYHNSLLRALSLAKCTKPESDPLTVSTWCGEDAAAQKPSVIMAPDSHVLPMRHFAKHGWNSQQPSAWYKLSLQPFSFSTLTFPFPTLPVLLGVQTSIFCIKRPRIPDICFRHLSSFQTLILPSSISPFYLELLVYT